MYVRVHMWTCAIMGGIDGLATHIHAIEVFRDDIVDNYVLDYY